MLKGNFRDCNLNPIVNHIRASLHTHLIASRGTTLWSELQPQQTACLELRLSTLH